MIGAPAHPRPPRFGPVGGEGAVAMVAALAGLDVGEVDALGRQLAPGDGPLVAGDVDALGREVALGRVPMPGMEPCPAAAGRGGEQRQAGPGRRPHLMWSTQIRVNRRRAVSKSISILPARLSRSSSAASLWRPRRAMSIVSSPLGESERTVLK